MKKELVIEIREIVGAEKTVVAEAIVKNDRPNIVSEAIKYIKAHRSLKKYRTGDIPDFIEYGKKFGIGWFVFASGSTGAFETIDAFLQNGARMGKFVVKEYSEKRFHSEETIRVPGVRINL